MTVHKVECPERAPLVRAPPLQWQNCSKKIWEVPLVETIQKVQKEGTQEFWRGPCSPDRMLLFAGFTSKTSSLL